MSTPLATTSYQKRRNQLRIQGSSTVGSSFQYNNPKNPSFHDPSIPSTLKSPGQPSQAQNQYPNHQQKPTINANSSHHFSTLSPPQNLNKTATPHEFNLHSNHPSSQLNQDDIPIDFSNTDFFTSDDFQPDRAFDSMVTQIFQNILTSVSTPSQDDSSSPLTSYNRRTPSESSTDDYFHHVRRFANAENAWEKNMNFNIDPSILKPIHFIGEIDNLISTLEKNLARTRESIQKESVQLDSNQLDFQRDLSTFSTSYASVLSHFSSLDSRISEIVNTTTPVGLLLEQLHKQKVNATQAKLYLETLHTICALAATTDKNEKIVIKQFQLDNPDEYEERLELLKTLYNCVPDLDSSVPNVGRLRQCVQQAYTEFESKLVSEMLQAYEARDFSTMKHRIDCVTQLNGGRSAIQGYLGTHYQTFNPDPKMVFSTSQIYKTALFLRYLQPRKHNYEFSSWLELFEYTYVQTLGQEFSNVKCPLPPSLSCIENLPSVFDVYQQFFPNELTFVECENALASFLAPKKADIHPDNAFRSHLFTNPHERTQIPVKPTADLLQQKLEKSQHFFGFPPHCRSLHSYHFDLSKPPDTWGFLIHIVPSLGYIFRSTLDLFNHQINIVTQVFSTNPNTILKRVLHNLLDIRLFSFLQNVYEYAKSLEFGQLVYLRTLGLSMRLCFLFFRHSIAPLVKKYNIFSGSSDSEISSGIPSSSSLASSSTSNQLQKQSTAQLYQKHAPMYTLGPLMGIFHSFFSPLTNDILNYEISLCRKIFQSALKPFEQAKDIYIHSRKSTKLFRLGGNSNNNKTLVPDVVVSLPTSFRQSSMVSATVPSKTLSNEMINVSRESIQRFVLLTDASKAAHGVGKCIQLLLDQLLSQYLVPSLDFSLEEISNEAHSSSGPSTRFLEIVFVLNDIVCKLRDHILVSTFEKYADIFLMDLNRKTLVTIQMESQLVSLETKVGAGLDLLLNGYLRHIQNICTREQKKSDFYQPDVVEDVFGPSVGSSGSVTRSSSSSSSTSQFQGIGSQQQQQQPKPTAPNPTKSKFKFSLWGKKSTKEPVVSSSVSTPSNQKQSKKIPRLRNNPKSGQKKVSKKVRAMVQPMANGTIACQRVVAAVETYIVAMDRTLSPVVREQMFTNLGFGLVDFLLSHYQKFQFNLNGGFVLLSDLNFYQQCFSLLGPAVLKKFQVLTRLAKIFIVDPLPPAELVSILHLEDLDQNLVHSYYQLYTGVVEKLSKKKTNTKN